MSEKRFVKAADLVSLYPELLGDVQRTYRLASLNILPHLRLGRQVYFDLPAVEAWIASGGQALPGGWRKASQSSEAA